MLFCVRVRNFRRFSFWANSTTEKSHLVLNSVAFGFADYRSVPLGGRPSLFFAPAKVPIAGMHVAGCAGGIFYSVRSMSHQYVSVAFDAFHQFGKPAVAFFYDVRSEYEPVHGDP